MAFWNKKKLKEISAELEVQKEHSKSVEIALNALRKSVIMGVTTPITTSPKPYPIPLNMELTLSGGGDPVKGTGRIIAKPHDDENDDENELPLDSIVPDRDTYSGQCRRRIGTIGQPGKRTFARFKEDPKKQNDGEYVSNESCIGCDEVDAHLISSFVHEHDGKRWHAPAIDIDLPVHVRESSPGKSHLFIDALVEEDDYFELLNLLAKMGIVESGYAKVSTAKKASYLRMPDIKKKGTDPERIVAGRKAAAMAALEPTGLIDMLEKLDG